MTLPFRVLLTVAAAGGAAAGSVGAGASQRGCSGTQSPGVCLWPKQQAFANLSVAGDEDMGTACCSACSAESRCVSWLVYTEPHSSYPAGTCILNDHQVMGQAPPLPACISGHVPPKPWPAPPPVPAPPGAKNVLFFAVDDLRPEINAFGGGSLSASVSVAVSVCVSLSLSLTDSVSLSVCLSVCVSVCLSVYPSLLPSLHLALSL